jgi:hypothetical protein
MVLANACAPACPAAPHSRTSSPLPSNLHRGSTATKTRVLSPELCCPTAVSPRRNPARKSATTPQAPRRQAAPLLRRVRASSSKRHRRSPSVRGTKPVTSATAAKRFRPPLNTSTMVTGEHTFVKHSIFSLDSPPHSHPSPVRSPSCFELAVVKSHVRCFLSSSARRRNTAGHAYSSLSRLPSSVALAKFGHLFVRRRHTLPRQHHRKYRRAEPHASVRSAGSCHRLPTGPACPCEDRRPWRSHRRFCRLQVFWPLHHLPVAGHRRQDLQLEVSRYSPSSPTLRHPLQYLSASIFFPLLVSTLSCKVQTLLSFYLALQ